MAFSTIARLSKNLLNKVPQAGLLLNRNLSVSNVRTASMLLRKPNPFICPQTPAFYQCIQKAHTKGDVELTEFLQTEIEAEKKLLNKERITSVEGFEIEANQAEITLKKTHKNEKIEIILNVNESVDSHNQEPVEDTEGASMIRSLPNFTVEIEKEGTKMAFSCSFIKQEEGFESEDIFQIEEVYFYENEFEESNYVVSAEMMDGYLYDLLMNMLSERGISNEFANNLVDYCTSYEHNMYVSMLEKLQKFVKV